MHAQIPVKYAVKVLHFGIPSLIILLSIACPVQLSNFDYPTPFNNYPNTNFKAIPMNNIHIFTLYEENICTCSKKKIIYYKKTVDECFN